MNAGDINKYTQEHKNDDSKSYQEGLKNLAYDLLYGDNYASNGKNPYKPTNIQLGLHEVKVSSVTPMYNSDGEVCVYGKYFTNYSKVYVNGEKQETTFVDKNTLTIDYPDLKKFIGEDLIVTDGTTLLGADDKAGISEIVTAIEYLVNNPEIKHGDIKIGFTPDEEIGRGADLFNVEKFGAKDAYTIDGGIMGELQYENFNAAGATITIQGRNVHPGAAKNKMINALHIAAEISQMFPQSERPETTEGYEGFYHLNDINGNVENATMVYIIRDHSKEKFEYRKQYMKDAISKVSEKYNGRVTLELNDQYYNMKEKVEPVKFIVDIAEEAMKECDITPIIVPIRGGTDGARLSFMGLPCPNIFTGGLNFHSKNECIPIIALEKCSNLIVKIAQKYAQR